MAKWPGSHDQLGQSQVRVATQSLAGPGWRGYVDWIRHSDPQPGPNGGDRCDAVISGKRDHSSPQLAARSAPDATLELRISWRTNLNLARGAASASCGH